MAPEDAHPIQQNGLPESLLNKAAQQILPFPDLSDEDATRILELATVRHLNSSDICFEEGDAAQNFYVLLDGVLRVVRTTSDGEQVVILHVTSGDLFGIAMAFSNDKYSASARVAAPGVALSWPSELWEEFSRDYPSFTTATRHAVGARLGEMRDKIVEMSTLRVEQRIAHALLRLAKQTGQQTESGLAINYPVTRQDISEMTGTTLHSVSRYMSRWQKRGIVNSSRRGIVVERPQDLPL